MSESTSTIERPPVVVVMGHIDHGKSTLLDFIRKSNIVSGEAGGITQHIAAYEVEHIGENGPKKITFLDTPGHEAFCAVRERGAQVADIAVLIVSAEDGVKPQTIEALNCIKEDGMPYVVAINKVDSPKADINMTKSSLIENEVYIEGMGGNISFVEISALKGDNVDELLNLILLTAEVEELTTDTTKPAEGIVVEAHKDDKVGISATIVIKDGNLSKGMFIAGHTSMSPVRSIINQHGQQIDSAIASSPVTISGWTTIPPTGSGFVAFNDKKDAEAHCKKCASSETENAAGIGSIDKNTLGKDDLVIPLIIKTDVAGTGEAVIHELKKVDIERVYFNVIENSAGNISEATMKTAAAHPGTVVVGFNAGIDTQAEALRERNEIKTKTFSIIYELTAWLKDIALERQPRIEVEEITGSAKILKTFNRSKGIHVIGGKVKDGVLNVGSTVRIMRRNEMIDTGVIKNAQQQRIDKQEIKEGEFGMAIASTHELAEGDMIEATRKVIK